MSYNSPYIRVWDPLLRIFHWSLATTFFIAYLTEDDWQSLHTAAGYTVAALVTFRLIWGIIGPHYARFSQFVKSPDAAIRHLRQMARRQAPHYLGHNPAAAAMIVVLLISLSLTTFGGMAILATEGSGPLADTFIRYWPAELLEEVHEFFANATLALVVLHLLGVAASSWLEQENLPRAMFTGLKKKRSDAVDLTEKAP